MKVMNVANPEEKPHIVEKFEMESMEICKKELKDRIFMLSYAGCRVYSVVCRGIKGRARENDKGTSMTISDINKTLEDFIFKLHAKDDDVHVFEQYKEVGPDVKMIFCLPTVAYGDVSEGELGKQGLSPRTSVFILAYSVISGEYYDRLLGVIDIAEKAFRRVDIPSKETGCIVHCGDSYTTNVGNIDGGRISMSVTVPFSTWTGEN